MKAVFISYNQALTERVMDTLDQLQIRGFTKWALTEGRGSVDGEPHYGSHAWASVNSSMMVIVEDPIAKELLKALRAVDQSAPMQGLRAFSWNVEDSI